MIFKQNIPFLVLFGIVPLLFAGCGPAVDTPDLGIVTGVVTMDGKPLANSVVTFNPETGRPSFGTTDANGKYELSYLKGTKGVKVGKQTVRITTAVKETDAEAPLEETVNADGSVIPTNKKKEKEKIPAKYNKNTTLTADVEAGENTIDFKLESK